MSKASEWAERYEATMATEPRKHIASRKDVGPYIDADADRQGQCTIRINGIPTAWLKPEHAIALARWILDTFGEA